jgi:hypothetical protein
VSKFLDALAGVGSVLQGEARVTLESNVLPAVGLLGGEGSSAPGILKSLGVRAGVVVRDLDGRVLARVGDPAPFEPLRAALLVAGVVGVVVLAVKLLRR